jgi:hypothetical protein
MIPYDLMEEVAHMMITLISGEPHYTREWVEGQNWDAEISDVKQDMREAVDAERFDLLPKLQARLAGLRGRKPVPGHYEKRDTGITVGEYLHRLDCVGQREYLKTRDIRAEKAPNRGVHLVIDGVDYGVIRLESETSPLA